jgi:hypothetical protein
MSNKTWEGLGGPVSLEEVNELGIDPGLEDCCRREVKSKSTSSQHEHK